MISFLNLNEKNKNEIHYLYPGDEGKYWVNFNWYWEHLSKERIGIEAQLIYADNIESPIGFIAYGQHYEDRLLKEPLKGISEIYHIVVHDKVQRRGIGKAVTIKALKYLAAKESFDSAYVACHPDNKAATAMYLKLGFKEKSKNYDDDPIYSISKSEISKLEVEPLTLAPLFIDKENYAGWYDQSLDSQKDFNWNNWELGLEE